MNKNKPKVLAVASEGGHWIQLQRVSPAFSECGVSYISTNEGLAKLCDDKVYVVQDASMWEKLKLIKMAIQVFIVVVKFRPNVVISTGAAPGFFALLFGKLVGARTIWLDSIANSEQMSLAGSKVKRYADYWLTQSPDLDKAEGPHYKGAVL